MTYGWPSSGGGGGRPDHGLTLGLRDDDHPQYYNLARLDAWFASKTPNAHTHLESDITDIGPYSPVGHGHVKTDISDFAHSHLEADISDLQSYSLVGHSHSYAPLVHTHDDRYYTEGEVDTLLSGKSSTSHLHTGVYAPNSHTHSYLPLSGGTMTGPISSGTVETLISMNRSGNNIISKGNSGDLYIDNSVTSGSIIMRADDSGGTIRNRIVIDGNSHTTLYDKAGSSRVAVKVPTANGSTTTREEGALWVGGGQLGTTAGNIGRAASFRLNNGNAQSLELQSIRYSSSNGWGSARLGFRLITDGTNHGSLWFYDNKILLHSTEVYGSARLQVAGGINFTPATTAGVGVYMVSVGGGRYALTDTSSALRTKKDLVELTSAEPIGAFHYFSKHHGVHQFGLVAEDVEAAMGKDAVHYEDGEIKDYYDRAVLANHEARLIALEERMAA